jgi:hypothetical protein
LVKRRQRRTAALNHLAIAPTADELGLGKMSEDLTDGPFARRRRLFQFVGRERFDKTGQRAGRFALHRERIFVFDVAPQARAVALPIRHGR